MAKSAKLRSVQADGGDECKLDLSPMIDMVFLLLIFFLVNASLIIVKIDKDVTPAVASESQRAIDGHGRIVVNVREGGVFTNRDGKILSTEDDIKEWVRTEKQKVDKTGKTPKLHLRGDKAAIFAVARKAIRAAASQEVVQVVFSVYVR